MTRSSSSQQTPASPEARTESGAEGEGTAVNPAAGAAPLASGTSAAPDTAAAPDSAPAQARSEAAAAPKSPESPESPKGEASGGPQVPEGEKSGAQKSSEAAAPAATAAAGSGAATSQSPAGTAGAQPGTSGTDPDSATDPDPSASAAAQSRLPALVRTMSATAIGQPQQEAGPVGRPGKAALAGAAVVGALLVSVPFLVLAGNNDDGPRQTNAAAAGTVLDGSGPEAPGEFAVTAPETSAAAEDEKGKKGDEGAGEKAGNAVPAIPPPAAPSDGGKDAPKKEAAPEAPAKKESAADAPAKKADSPKAQPKKESGGAKNQPAKAAPAVTFSGPVSFRSHLSGRCLDVPGHNFNDGQRLFMWDCNGAEAQKWRFGSDGTIRAKDKCLDVANANFGNGTPIQLAWCNGSAAQKFTLNGAHDLVNTVVGKCVDIPNHSKSRGPSTYLILWECTGNDNQKWST
ncbi:ricin-type beta-trefoil lectin domain protein [Streptomyces cyaneofuscatus]|uniref:ricin-type beta-trefoil lectin domain protein n=1 Tax=Streptomyces cyaneofuscatus TaxID=66883 RepID=UPI0033A72ADC